MSTSKEEMRSLSATYPTGSKFLGSQNDMGMQRFGLYMYPDGTKYVGHFYNNRFHGDGTIEIPFPHCVSFNVLHHHGKLIKILGMTFNDNLEVEFELNNDTITFDKWNYCTKQDRRFCAEKLGPMEAVGPNKYKTRDGPNPMPLGRSIFDLGFGKFNRHGILTGMPNHMSKTREIYVDSPEVRAWILNNCRHGDLRNIHVDQEMLAQSARQIIQNNLTHENELVGELFRDFDTSVQPKSETSLSAKELRLRMNSMSDSCSSNLEPKLNRLPSQTCEDCFSTKMKQQSDDCVIN